jgi:hypothetical protein
VVPPAAASFGGSDSRRDLGVPGIPSESGARDMDLPSWDMQHRPMDRAYSDGEPWVDSSSTLGTLRAPPLSQLAPSPSKLPQPGPPKTSLNSPLPRQNSRRPPPGLFDEVAPSYTSLPSIDLGAHESQSGAGLMPRHGVGGSGAAEPPLSWTSYGVSSLMTPDTFAVDAAPSADAGGFSRQPFGQPSSSYDPAPLNSFDQWGSALAPTRDSYVPGGPPTGLSRVAPSASVDPFQASSSTALPSIPGVDSNNIWSAGSVFGELDWARPQKEKMDPDAKDFSPW